MSSATRRLSNATKAPVAALRRKASDASPSSASPALARMVSTDDAARTPESKPARIPRSPARARPFHSSSRDSASITSLPAGAVADVDPDTVVPQFYIEFKRQRDAILERKELENELMSELSAGLLSDGIAATMRRLPNKIPTEHAQDGQWVHPSGFVVPSPGAAVERMADRRARDSAIQTSGVRERVQEEDFTGINAQLRSREQKVPFEVRAKDGTICHPSGFVPPTPAHDFTGRLGQDWATDPKRAFQY
ncbi:hypothetical protein DENSPDRAFT_836650 [Dentipellis sp. KUC8613]|nr:hypothetical protein DENSPDRAFT_836650 [Dentipellis sp. KUC8613]